MDDRDGKQGAPREAKGRRTNAPLLVGAFFAVLAIVLTFAGLWRENNLSLRNMAVAVVLCGGAWGLISWAIATAVVQVEEDVAARRGQNG